MTFYPDLSECRYFSRDKATGDSVAAGRLIAVGWLDNALPTDPVEPSTLTAVVSRLVAIWEAHVDPWGISMGRHGCGLCGRPADRAPATLVTYRGRQLCLGSGFITVPAPGVLYVAPSLILHYILDHGYQPPSEFCAAVERCPRPRSWAYRRALRREGPPGLLEQRVLPRDSWRAWVPKRVWAHVADQTALGRLLRRLLLRT